MKQRYRKTLGLRFGCCCIMKQRDMKEAILHTSQHNNALQQILRTIIWQAKVTIGHLTNQLLSPEKRSTMGIYFTLLINFFVYLNFHVHEYLLHELFTWLNFIYLNSMFNFQQINNPKKKKKKKISTMHPKTKNTANQPLI